jgi:hypothetical protein
MLRLFEDIFRGSVRPLKTMRLFEDFFQRNGGFFNEYEGFSKMSRGFKYFFKVM